MCPYFTNMLLCMLLGIVVAVGAWAALSTILCLIVNLTLIKSFVQRNNQKKVHTLKRNIKLCTYTCRNGRSCVYRLCVNAVWTLNIHHFQRGNSRMQLQGCCHVRKWKMNTNIEIDPEHILQPMVAIYFDITNKLERHQHRLARSKTSFIEG